MLFHRGHVVLDGLANALKIRAKVLNVLERPASFSVEPLQNAFELVMSTFPGDEALKEGENRKLWNVIVIYGVERLDKERRNSGTTRYLSTKKLLLEYIESDS